MFSFLVYMVNETAVNFFFFGVGQRKSSELPVLDFEHFWVVGTMNAIAFPVFV